MQEIKALVRSFFVFLRGPIKRIFRAVPLFERIARAIFRRFPAVALFYLRLLSPPSVAHVTGPRADSQRSELDAAGSLTSEPLFPPKKRKLTPHANLIFVDLKAAVRHVGSGDDEGQINKGSQ